MKKSFLLLGLFGVMFSSLYAQFPTQQEVNERLQNLPFASPEITVPGFPDRTFNIAERGAVGNGIFKNTDIINNTIIECSKAGGGKVVIPRGVWLTGPITMQSHVNLHLQAGALVVFSDDINDYKLTGSNFSNIESQINGSNLENVAITGRGVFNGNGDRWRPVKKEKVNDKQWKALIKTGEVAADGKTWYPRVGTIAAIDLKQNTPSAELKTREANERVKLTMRPYLLNVENLKNMVVEGVTLQNSAHIANMLRRIDGLVMKDVKVLNQWWSQNADGLDISACRNVLLYDCSVNTGDDGICMKSTRSSNQSEFGLENIVIRDCKVFRGHGGFVIGSNTDGGMNNIFVSNCTFNWTQTGLRFKSGIGRGGRVQNIFIEDIFMKDIENEAVIFEVEYSDSGAITAADHSEAADKVPDFNGVTMKNIVCESAGKAISIKGEKNVLVRNIAIENAVIQAETGASLSFADGITLDNVKILVNSGVTYVLNQTSSFRLKNLADAVSGDFMVLMGDRTNNILLKNTGIKAENVKINAAVPAGAFHIE